MNFLKKRNNILLLGIILVSLMFLLFFSLNGKFLQGNLNLVYNLNTPAKNISSKVDLALSRCFPSYKSAFILLYKNKAELTAKRQEVFNTMKNDFHVSFAYATKNLASMDTSDEIVDMPFDDSLLENYGNYKVISPQAVAKKFYQNHDDKYDFIIISKAFSEDDKPDAQAYYTPVVQNITGIGKPLSDISKQYGSKGKLEGVIILRMIDLFDIPLNIQPTPSRELLHEVGHKWCCYVGSNFMGNHQGLEILRNGVHLYSGIESTFGDISPMGANHWVPNPDGTYKSSNDDQLQPFYSPIELYLMGLLPKSEYNKKYPIYDFCMGKNPQCEQHASLYGYVSINDIIQNAGARTCNP